MQVRHLVLQLSARRPTADGGPGCAASRYAPETAGLGVRQHERAKTAGEGQTWLGPSFRIGVGGWRRNT